MKFINELHDEYFDWLKFTKTKLLSFILARTGENEEYSNNFFTHPILGDEKNFSYPVITHSLSKVFIACKFKVSTLYVKHLKITQGLQRLKSKLNRIPIEDLTAATQAALDNIHDPNKVTAKKLLSHVDKRATKAALNFVKSSGSSASSNHPSTKSSISSKSLQHGRKKYSGAQQKTPPVPPLEKSSEQNSKNTTKTISKNNKKSKSAPPKRKNQQYAKNNRRNPTFQKNPNHKKN